MEAVRLFYLKNTTITTTTYDVVYSRINAEWKPFGFSFLISAARIAARDHLWIGRLAVDDRECARTNRLSLWEGSPNSARLYRCAMYLHYTAM